MVMVRKAFLVVVLSLGMFAASAQAGALDAHGGAYGPWTGSTAFDNGLGLAGYVDFAVFAPGAFPYGGAGYTPTAGELTYVFQVFNTGTEPITSMWDALFNTANNIGFFTSLGGDGTISTLLVPPPGGKAEWTFDGVGGGGSTGFSQGLVFSSLKVPEMKFGLVINGGMFEPVVPLPTPSAVDIPEPMTLSLLGVGALALLRRRRR